MLLNRRVFLRVACVLSAFGTGALATGQTVESRFNQATAAMQAGRYPEAEAQFHVVLAADPNSVAAMANLAVVFSRTHRFAEAIALDQQALLLDPGDPSLLVNLGLAYMKEEQYAQAVPVFRELAARNETNDRFQILLATCLILGDAPRQGLDLIETKRLETSDPTVPYLQAVGYARLDQVHAAEAIYQRLLADPETHAQASFLLGQAMHDGHRLPEAESAFEDTLRGNSLFPGAHRELGKVYISMQRFADAERELRTAITQDPQDGSALYFLGALLVQSAREEAGVPFLDRAEALMPDSWAIPFYLGKAQYRRGHATQAVTLLQKAAAMNSEEPEVFYLLARALSSSGHPDEAKVAMQRVQSLHSSALEAEKQAMSQRVAGAR